jgi:meiotic recombination protein SPO11
MQISGDIRSLEAYTFQSEARYILVVEKDAVFQRLSEDRFFMTVPSILITAKGFPDLATR